MIFSICFWKKTGFNYSAHPSEMKNLHPDGERFELDYIPGQLNFSPSDVESKLKQFPPGSSGGPSGWGG